MMAYWGLFVSSFLAATILPFGSEAILLGLLVSGYDACALVVVATMGNWLGSMSTYWLGMLGNWSRIERWLGVSRQKAEKFELYVGKYGSWFGLLAWVPVIGDVIVVCMGVVRTPLVQTSIMILVGKLIRYIIVAFLTINGLDMLS